MNLKAYVPQMMNDTCSSIIYSIEHKQIKSKNMTLKNITIEHLQQKDSKLP